MLDLPAILARARNGGTPRQTLAADCINLAERIRELEADLSKQKRIQEIQSTAVDRWVPCPDHRDKINVGHEEKRCYVCLNETLERRVRELEAGPDYRRLHAALKRVDELEAGLDTCIEVMEFAYMNAPKQPKEINEARRLLGKGE